MYWLRRDDIGNEMTHKSDGALRKCFVCRMYALFIALLPYAGIIRVK